eukprot:scaffold47655_cov20-Prasinocladus_malaysianus.AAC.1
MRLVWVACEAVGLPCTSTSTRNRIVLLLAVATIFIIASCFDDIFVALFRRAGHDTVHSTSTSNVAALGRYLARQTFEHLLPRLRTPAPFPTSKRL